MTPRTTDLMHHPTDNAPKGPAIPLVGPLFSSRAYRIETRVHLEFSRL